MACRLEEVIALLHDFQDKVIYSKIGFAVQAKLFLLSFDDLLFRDKIVGQKVVPLLPFLCCLQLHHF